MVLERGELKLSYEDGRFRIRYFDNVYPVSPRVVLARPALRSRSGC